MTSFRVRRSLAGVILSALIAIVAYAINSPQIMDDVDHISSPQDVKVSRSSAPLAIDQLQSLRVKGRAPKTGYARTQFGSGWATQDGCDTRNNILLRDLKQAVRDDDCHVVSGVLDDPYTGEVIRFTRGKTTSSAVQIDHVVALSNAWQTGAQELDRQERVEFANDALNLLAVDGPANQQKSDSDAASWLPKYKPFRCQYVARQVAIKLNYSLWVTPSEKQAIERVLSRCPEQTLPRK